jgi:hypothetical protein
MHCLYTAYTPPMHCLFAAYSMHCLLHCLFTVHALPMQLSMQLSIALPMQLSMPVHCLCTAYALPMHCPCTPYALSMHSLCTVYALSTHCLGSAYALSMNCYVSACVKFTTFSCFIRIKRDPFSLILRHALANMCFYICTTYYGAKRFRSQSSFSPNRSICENQGGILPDMSV